MLSTAPRPANLREEYEFVLKDAKKWEEDRKKREEDVRRNEEEARWEEGLGRRDRETGLLQAEYR